MCRDYKSGNRCTYRSDCLYRHADGEEKPIKKSKKESTQGAVAILKEKIQSKEVYSAESWANENERFDGTHHIILRTHLVRNSNSGKNGHLETISKKVNLMSEILARPSLRKKHLRKPQDKKSVPAKQHGIWREKTKLKAEDKATFHSPVKIKAPVLVSTNTEERMFVVDSGASMHMLSKKDLSSDDMDTLRRSRTRTTAVTANGKQENRATIQGFQSLFGRSQNLERKSWKTEVNCLKLLPFCIEMLAPGTNWPT